jgi:DNA-directed RNA polymerase subunit L
MKVNVVKSSDNEIKLEIEGAGHSLLNVLQKTLLQDSKIEVAGYHVPHPLIDKGVLFVHTKDKVKPEDAILDATQKVLDLSNDFETSFKKASKAYKSE